MKTCTAAGVLVRSALLAALTLALPVEGWALSVDQRVTHTYLRQHSKELSIKVTRRPDGMVAFTIVRTLTEPKYFVARLLAKKDGKTLAETSIPTYGRKLENNFHFAIAPDALADSEFELGESHLAGSGDQAVPIPGTITYQFRLRDFVPEEMFKGMNGK